MIVPYNSKPKPIAAIKDIPEELKERNKDKEQDELVIEEHASRLVRVAR